MWLELRTQRGNTIVVKDDELPEATKGRIYLFNTAREAMVEYDADIVTPKLFELDASQQTDAESQFGKSWLEARKQVMKKHGKHVTSDDEAPESESKESTEGLTGDIDMPGDDDEELFDDDEQDDG